MAKEGIINVPVYRSGSEKLRVVEDVKRFQAKLKCLGFCDGEIFHQHQVRVEHTWPGKISPRRGANRTYCIVGKRSRIEIL